MNIMWFAHGDNFIDLPPSLSEHFWICHFALTLRGKAFKQSL